MAGASKQRLDIQRFGARHECIHCGSAARGLYRISGADLSQIAAKLPSIAPLDVFWLVNNVYNNTAIAQEEGQTKKCRFWKTETRDPRPFCGCHLVKLDVGLCEMEIPKYALHLAVRFRPENLDYLLSNGHPANKLDDPGRKLL